MKLDGMAVVLALIGALVAGCATQGEVTAVSALVRDADAVQAGMRVSVDLGEIVTP
jgi:hypothetical protein